VANAAANRHVTVFAIKWNTTASIYNTTVLHKPQGADHEAKMSALNSYLWECMWRYLPHTHSV